MSPWSGSRPPRPIFFGLALITVGVLLLLRELGAVPDIGLWTLIWLALGSWLFLGTLAGNRRGWFWPLTLLLIGSFMLLRDLDVLEADFSIRRHQERRGRKTDDRRRRHQNWGLWPLSPDSRVQAARAKPAGPEAVSRLVPGSSSRRLRFRRSPWVR